MDISTASDTDTDTDEDLSVQSANRSIHLKNVPAFVAWRTSDGENRSLSDLNLSLEYNANTESALVTLQTTTRLKKGSTKPSIFLFIKPDQICSLTHITADEEDLGHDEELHRHAREKLGTSTNVLRFELGSPPTFVVPNEYPFKFFRAGSQAVWRSWTSFAKETHCFFLHFPMKSLSKARLISFCRVASTRGALTSFENNIISLYGGKSGKVVNPHADVGDDITQDEADGVILNDENNAPPAYEERATAGSSASAVAPPLCLSPGPDLSRSRKRRREDNSSTDHEDTSTHKKTHQLDDMLLRAILGLQRTVEETRAAQEANLTKIMVKVEQIEDRFKELEESQRNLVDEVRMHMAPLWDELDGRLQSQEDREYVYMRDTIEEVVDENIKEKMVEVVDEYFNDDDGQGLIREVVGEMIQEETRDFLQSQRFTANISINRESPST
ncbi:hypothetical protein EV127DRAFT_406481 [Xylaria flabelliformis]|nr:hypothetical protein EV127DRAFT_406481 [Xylaria flabelliformis]